MKDRIACITKQRAAEILDSISEGNKYSPKGLFLHREGGHYIGIDNSNGEAWTEQFTTLGDCIDWLRGNADMDDIWTREAERVRDKIFCPSCHQGSSFTQWNNAEGTSASPLDLKHEIENDDEDDTRWIHCPYCDAMVAVHMIIEENQDRIGWMSWKQELDTVEEDIIAELDYPSEFQVMLEKRSHDLLWFNNMVAVLPENSWLEQVLDGLYIYIREGIDQDEPRNIVETIKHQQEALHSLRAEKDSFAGSTVRLAKQVDTLLGQLKDAGKNISKRDQKIAELENLRAADRANAPHLLDELRKAKEEIGKLSSLKDVLVDGINKAESKANRVSSKLHIITEAIQQFTEENEKQ